MYAILQIGSKQYRVHKEQCVKIEKVNDFEKRNFITFNQVVMIVNHSKVCIGKPFVNGASVKAEILFSSREKKIKIIKLHRRKHFRKYKGHRQWFSMIKIVDIVFL